MENYKTLGQMLQEIVENENKWYSLHEFLLESTDEDRKIVQDKLVDADYKQFYEFMDSYSFVNKDEVYMAVSQYYEFVIDRPISMWECGDLDEVADDYIAERGLKFENDED